MSVIWSGKVAITFKYTFKKNDTTPIMITFKGKMKIKKNLITLIINIVIIQEYLEQINK